MGQEIEACSFQCNIDEAAAGMKDILEHQADDQKGHDLGQKHQHTVHAFHFDHPAGEQDGQGDSECSLGDGADCGKQKRIFDKHSVIRAAFKNF